MHGGHRGGRVNFRYYVHGDQIYTGLTVVSFTLQEIAEEDGGFACIPGSHKCDFHVPPDDHKRLFAIDGPLVRNIAAPKGSAIIFTETLAHGAASWQGDEPRYGVFFKYNDRAATYGYRPYRLPSKETPWRSSRRRSASSSMAPGRRSARRTTRTTITRRPECCGRHPARLHSHAA